MIPPAILDAWALQIASAPAARFGPGPAPSPELLVVRVERERGLPSSLTIDVVLPHRRAQRILSTLHPEQSAVPLPPDVFVALARPDGPDLLRRCPGAWIQAGGASPCLLPRPGQPAPIQDWEAMLTKEAHERLAAWRPALRRLAAEGPLGIHPIVPGEDASAHLRLAADALRARAGAERLLEPVTGRPHHVLLAPGRAALVVEGGTGPRPLLVEVP